VVRAYARRITVERAIPDNYFRCPETGFFEELCARQLPCAPSAPAVSARPVFATGTRFPDADEVTVDWPHG
jgi:hypothetical protein